MVPLSGAYGALHHVRDHDPSSRERRRTGVQWVDARDIVRVVGALADHTTLRAALIAVGVAPARWPVFERAVAALVESEMLGERALVG